MAQYDVYENPQPASRHAVPFVVDVQSGLIDQLPTRFVVPLSRVGIGESALPTTLCPTVEIDGQALSFMSHLAAPVPARALRKPVASIAHRVYEIRTALDAVVSDF